MGVLEAIGLLAAALAAGSVNAVAGGGSLISFPSLVAAGYAAKTANVTNTVALWPGYFGGSLAYRNELRRQRRRLVLLLAPSVLGALVGSAVLLATPGGAFEAVVPFLILFATGLMASQERLAAFAADHHLNSRGPEDLPWVLNIAMFALAVYGAYFGAGLGILIMASLTILMPDDIQHSNALKGVLSMVINAVAVLYFALFGPVQWGAAALMAGGALAGGYLGAGIARRLGSIWLRRAIIALGLAVSAVLFGRYYW